MPESNNPTVAGREAPTVELMRAEFLAWVQDCGCDTDGAWSAWQGAWNRCCERLARSPGAAAAGVVGTSKEQPK